MEANVATQTIISTINTIFEQLFGSLDNNLYSTLDDITLVVVEDSDSYNMQIQGILALSNLNSTNGGQEAQVTVTIEAIQTANYNSSNWSSFDV